MKSKLTMAIAALVLTSCVTGEVKPSHTKLSYTTADQFGDDLWVSFAGSRSTCLAGRSGRPELCPRLYTDPERSMLLVEVCESDGAISAGIHLVGRRGARVTYPWFDEEHMQFACHEGCNSTAGCYYELANSQDASGYTELVYHYDINLSFGRVVLGLGPSGDLKVREVSNTNVPS